MRRDLGANFVRNYLIIDFGASLLHTHHSRVIRGFVELIKQNEDDLLIYIPFGSEIEDSSMHGKTRRILIPSYHPVAFKWRKSSSWIPGLTRLLYSRSENTKIHKTLSFLLSDFLVEATFLTIRKVLRRRPDSILLFPTACPISIRLGRRIKTTFPSIKLAYRLTNTAEKRGYFAKHFDLASEISELDEFSSKDIRFGFEMEEYGATLGIPGANLFYSPTPPCSERIVESSSSSTRTFGFLGMAQKHKGVSWLLKIIIGTSANFSSKSLRWVVQTENPSPSELTEIAIQSDVTLLPGRLSEVEMSDAFSKIHLICLPYNIDSYKLNASALAYRAADNLTAVATLRGSAFGNEIEKFKLGIVADDLADLISKMSNFDIDATKLYIAKYNLLRHEANLRFLSW
jgi:hypothetical protein